MGQNSMIAEENGKFLKNSKRWKNVKKAVKKVANTDKMLGGECLLRCGINTSKGLYTNITQSPNG